MRFVKNHFYIHKDFMDVFIEVIWAGHYNNRWKLKIIWWNRNCGNEPYCLYIRQRVEIPDEKTKDWNVYRPKFSVEQIIDFLDR